MMNHEGDLPENVPVMVLGGCNLFPQCLLPLHIFETRYREMLQYALERDRMICMGNRKINSLEGPDEEIHQFTTVGMIRACVHRDDGTSNLVLQGIQRARIVDWGQVEPFRIARIQPLETTDSDSLECDALTLRVRELARDLIRDEAQGSSRLSDFLDCTDDAEMLADVVAFHLIGDPYERQELLGISSLHERLRCVIGHLESVDGGKQDFLFD